MSRRNFTVVVTIAFAACATVRTEEPRAEQPRVMHLEPWRPTPTGELVGRVTLDGQPVPYFGVSVVLAKFSNSQPTPVRSADGRFAIKLERGTWDLIFAGPGFARIVVPNVTIAESGNAPLEVAVTHGYTIDGTVVDPVGNPVGGASVRIRQGVTRHAEDTLGELARGDFSTVTNAAGHFQFDDVVAIHGTASVSASLLPAVGASQSEEIGNRDASIHLVILSVGEIRGSFLNGTCVATDPRTAVAVVAQSVSSTRTVLTAFVEENCSFRFEDVPVGSWDLGVLDFARTGRPELTQRVTVVPGVATKVTLYRP